MFRGPAFVHFKAEGTGDLVFDGEEAELVGLVHHFGEGGVFCPRCLVPSVFTDDSFASPDVVVLVSTFELTSGEFWQVGDALFDVSDHPDPDTVIPHHEDIPVNLVSDTSIDCESTMARFVKNVLYDFATGVVVIQHDAGASHNAISRHDMVKKVVLDAGAIAPELGPRVDCGTVAFFETDIKELVLLNQVIVSAEDESLSGEVVHEVVAEDVTSSAKADGGSDPGKLIEIEVSVGNMVFARRDFGRIGLSSGESCKAGDIVNIAGVGPVVGSTDGQGGDGGVSNGKSIYRAVITYTDLDSLAGNDSLHRDVVEVEVTDVLQRKEAFGGCDNESGLVADGRGWPEIEIFLLSVEIPFPGESISHKRW